MFGKTFKPILFVINASQAIATFVVHIKIKYEKQSNVSNLLLTVINGDGKGIKVVFNFNVFTSIISHILLKKCFSLKMLTLHYVFFLRFLSATRITLICQNLRLIPVLITVNSKKNSTYAYKNPYEL